MYLAMLKRELRKLINSKRAHASAWFFKTGKGEYGEGDRFLGIKVPEQRKVAKRYYKEITLEEIQTLLKSKIHEERFVALEMLAMKYEDYGKRKMKNGKSNIRYPSFTSPSKGEDRGRAELVTFYLKHTKYVNNWDLVDTSAPCILGDYLLKQKDRKVLFRLARSENLWERRIAMVSTNALIQKGQFDDTINIANVLLNDEHDLIHKAVGWMLREVGKKDVRSLESFLNKHAHRMPRTMLRYAIEKFPEKKRKWYLGLKKIELAYFDITIYRSKCD